MSAHGVSPTACDLLLTLIYCYQLYPNVTVLLVLITIVTASMICFILFGLFWKVVRLIDYTEMQRYQFLITTVMIYC